MVVKRICVKENGAAQKGAKKIFLQVAKKCAILFCLGLLPLLVSGCTNRTGGGGGHMTTNYFVYCYVKSAGASRATANGDYVAVLELTELGKQQKTLIIPDNIDGKPVVQIGMSGLGYSYSIARGGKYK